MRRSDGRWDARYTIRDPKTRLTLRKSLYGKTEQEVRALLIEALLGRRKGSLRVRRGRAPSLLLPVQRVESLIDTNYRAACSSWGISRPQPTGT